MDVATLDDEAFLLHIKDEISHLDFQEITYDSIIKKCQDYLSFTMSKDNYEFFNNLLLHGGDKVSILNQYIYLISYRSSFLLGINDELI